jgi:hypothetical protein
MHQKRPELELPAAHAATRVTANDGDPAAALRIAARWCATTHATEHRARPSIDTP